MDLLHIQYIVFSGLGVAVSWWALQACKLEKLFSIPGSLQARAFHLILAIIMGHHVASFLMSLVSRAQFWTP